MLNETAWGPSAVTKTTKAPAKSVAKKAAKKTVKKATKKTAKKVAKKAAKPKGKKILLPIRLSPEADRLLRTSEKGYLIGNLTKRVIAAVEAANLTTIKVEDRPRIPGQGKGKDYYAMTTVQLPADIKKRLSDVAEDRGISMSALIEASILKFFKK